MYLFAENMGNSMTVMITSCMGFTFPRITPDEIKTGKTLISPIIKLKKDTFASKNILHTGQIKME